VTDMDAPFPFKLYKCAGWDDRYAVDGCWAQPEGSALEWSEVIEAMKSRKTCSPGIRLNAEEDVYGYVLSSPRNQHDFIDAVFIPNQHIDGWIETAEKVLGEQCNPNRPSAVTPR